MEASEQPVTWQEWKAQHRWPRLTSVEWALKRLMYQCQGSATFWLIEVAGWIATVAAVVAGVVLWFWEADDRKKQSHYRAWELINSARGSTGDGGRRDALQDLVEDSVDLSAAPLSKAYLDEVQLSNARLVEVDLTEANLISANLTKADLTRAKLTKANLNGANLTEAILFQADLSEVKGYSSSLDHSSNRPDLFKKESNSMLSFHESILAAEKTLEEKKKDPFLRINLSKSNLSFSNIYKADLSWSNLSNANLYYANMTEINLEGADLTGSNLRGVKLSAANLERATLTGADLHWADLSAANLNNVNLEDATFCLTTMPNGILNNRDCSSEPASPTPSKTPPAPN